MPCLTRCIDCTFSEENQKKLKCTKGLFDVKIIDGILLVPIDFECMEFIRKEKEGNDNEE